MSLSPSGSTSLLEQVASGIWTCAGETVNFHGFPFPTRMTVIQSGDGNLWIHSPGKLDDALKLELHALGIVRFLISPNKLHHLFLQEWIDYYPEALVYSSPGLEIRRPRKPAAGETVTCAHHAMGHR